MDLKDELAKLLKEHCKKIKKQSRQESANKIYMLLSPAMVIWIKGFIRGRTSISEGEILSLSWDCFEYCMEHYPGERDDIPCLNHFHLYTRYFVSSWLSGRSKIRKRETRYEDAPEEYQDPTAFYEQIDELKKFREMLPDNRKDIFDEAIMSMGGSPRDKIRNYEKGKPYTYYQYCEAKKIFKIVIKFLLSS